MATYDVSDRAALVTGGGSGIGRATAELLAANGARVLVADLTDQAHETVEVIQAGGGVVADSDPESEYQETVNKAKALVRAAQEAIRYASDTGRANR